MKLANIRRAWHFYSGHFPLSVELARQVETTRLKSLPKYQEQESLIRYGAKYYSQNEEDGIIREIFVRIGTGDRTFVEFGVGDGLENNSLLLLFDGWRGLWIEGGAIEAAAIRDGLSNLLASGKLRFEESFVTPDTVNKLIGIHFRGEVDLLSVDIDGNDLHVIAALHVISPRVICAEYNAKFPPPTRYVMPLDNSHLWDGTDCYGVSLQALADHLRAAGYQLVGCDLTGTNAFFVRDDLIGDRFDHPGDVAFHFEPARYYIARPAAGHPPSHRTLDDLYRAATGA